MPMETANFIARRCTCFDVAYLCILQNKILLNQSLYLTERYDSIIHLHLSNLFRELIVSILAHSNQIEIHW